MDVRFVDNYIKGSEAGQSIKFGVGGAISTHGAGVSLTIHGTENIFDGNLAREGGAIRSFDASTTSIANATFKGNAALSGGGVHSSFTTKSKKKRVVMNGVEFVRNTAFVGGGLMVDAKNANESFIPQDGLAKAVFLDSGITEILTIQLNMEGVVFKEQTTVQDGGGMNLVDVHAKCTGCEFIGNKVHCCTYFPTSSALMSCPFWSCCCWE